MTTATQEDIVRLANIVRNIYSDLVEDDYINQYILNDIDNLIYDLEPESE